MIRVGMKKQYVLIAALNAVTWVGGVVGKDDVKRSTKLEASTGNEQIVCTLDLLNVHERNDFFLVSKILQFFSDKKNDEKTLIQQLANLDEMIEDKLDKELHKNSDLTEQEVTNLKKLVKNYHVAAVTIGNYSDSAITIPNKGYIKELAQYEVDKTQILKLYPRLSERSDDYKFRTKVFFGGSFATTVSGIAAAYMGCKKKKENEEKKETTSTALRIVPPVFGALALIGLTGMCWSGYRFCGPEQELNSLMSSFQTLLFNINNTQLNDVNTNITTYSSGSYGFVIPAQSVFTTFIFLDKTKFFTPRTTGNLTLNYA